MTENRSTFAAETVRYGYRPTATGLAAIAATRRGVAAVLLGSETRNLGHGLATAMPEAILVADETGHGPLLDAVAAYIDSPIGEPGFDLDLRGSECELAVWTALRAIPMGETRSYGLIARSIGIGLSAQEVGAACAANRLAVVVPCHRVVKADGSLSGFRWGVHRKRSRGSCRV